MKEVLISIKPKWCELIANGKKTIEVRKTRPKIETPFKCYIYCTKPKFDHEDYIELENIYKSFYGGGKVIGEFVCDEIYTIDCDSTGFFYKEKKGYIKKELEYNSCLSEGDIYCYLFPNKGYGWHISDLKIYNEQKYLIDFGIKHPPKPWCYVKNGGISMRKTVVFDFDGVIHKGYKGYKDGSIYGEIDDNLLDFIKDLMNDFYIVVSSNRDADQIVDFLNAYQQKILFKKFEKNKNNLYWEDAHSVGVTNQKAIGVLYIDDRGYRYNSKTSLKCIDEIKNILYDKCSKSVRPDVEKLLEEADQAAIGKGEFYTYEDVFSEE